MWQNEILILRVTLVLCGFIFLTAFIMIESYYCFKHSVDSFSHERETIYLVTLEFGIRDLGIQNWDLPFVAVGPRLTGSPL